MLARCTDSDTNTQHDNVYQKNKQNFKNQPRHVMLMVMSMAALVDEHGDTRRRRGIQHAHERAARTATTC
jgi:hypothetical protein